MRIDRYGKVKRSSFDVPELLYGWDFGEFISHPRTSALYKDNYLQNLKSVAFSFGYSASDIDCLLESGFSCEEIEGLLYLHELDGIYDYKREEIIINV